MHGDGISYINCRQEKKTIKHPNYKYAVTIRKKKDREKLDAKPCRDCEKVPFNDCVHVSLELNTFPCSGLHLQLAVYIMTEENISEALVGTSISISHQIVTRVYGTSVSLILRSAIILWLPSEFLIVMNFTCTHNLCRMNTTLIHAWW